MISRHWKGIAKPGCAEEYVHHLTSDTFPRLALIPGFVRASILSRAVEAGTEFQIVTVWKSLDAIEAFAGARIDVAVVPPLVAQLMASYDSRVVHYETADTFESIGKPASSHPGLMILVAGPYRSGTGDDPAQMAANVRAMESCALPLFRAGHIPVVGEWFALPLVALAGSQRVGDAPFQEIFHPIAERLLERCDAVLRVGGPSEGADLMVRVAEERGLVVFRGLSEVPGCASRPAVEEV